MKKFKKYFLEDHPIPHICVHSKKKVHGWWPGKRECTAERMLINPYNGCQVGCVFCYANAFSWGFFKLFREKNILTVCQDYDREVAHQLDALDVASCGYLSPMTDPFQPIEATYHLSEKIISIFVERNIPVEFITKCRVPDHVLQLLTRQQHSFGQFSVLTPREKLRKKLVFTGSAATDELFSMMQKMRSLRYQEAGTPLHVVCRIDPVIPYVTSAQGDLIELLRLAEHAGVRHVVASCMDIPLILKEKIFTYLYKLNPSPGYPYEKLYCEHIDGSLHAHISFRRKLFSFMRDAAAKRGMTFAVCMEYTRREPFEVACASGKTKRVSSQGLNQEFMTAENCEGSNIPVYVRKGDDLYTDSRGVSRPVFVPATSAQQCNGNCLQCTHAFCGYEDLAMGANIHARKDFLYRDYRRWSLEKKN